MFPLGGVLFPSSVLPLHVFEPRYRELMRHCLEGEPEFGVVLIARGTEVGGGDTRTDIGTIARILEAAQLPDGRWLVGTVGTTRIRVVRWLPDDPYPRAEVEDYPDPPAGDAGPEVPDDRYADVVSQLRRALALATELGIDAAPMTIELPADPALGSFQVAAVSPIGPADEYRVLERSSPSDRLELLATLLGELTDDYQRRLALG